MTEGFVLPHELVWDPADYASQFPSTTRLTKFSSREALSTGLPTESLQGGSATPQNWSDQAQVPVRERDWDSGTHEDPAKSWQREDKAPDWSIGINPSCGFADAPLSYLARQMPLSDHGDLHAYHHQLIESSTKSHATAIHRWVDLLWNVARSHELLFRGIVYFGRYHEKSTSATHNSFLSSKTPILRLISARMQRSGAGSPHDGRTLVAIALLAYSDMIDGDFDAAETHVRALPLLSAAESWSPYEWVYIAWIDLRLALLRGQRPNLEYYIPAPFRDPPIPMSQQGARARKLALSNSKHGPRKDKDPAFTNVCFHMFSTLHEIGIGWDSLHQSGEVPFGTLYELEYSLRTMQVDIRATEHPNCNGYVKELILLCIQLHTWILARFWIPQRQETYMIVLQRAQVLLQELTSVTSTEPAPGRPKPFGQGPRDFLDPTCVMWITFTLAGTAIEYGHPCQILCLHILGSTAKSLHVKNHNDILRQLHKWPWLDNWHQSKLTLLWPRIRSLLGLPLQRWQNIIDGFGTADDVRVEQPPSSMSFFGGLEFYVDD